MEQINQAVLVSLRSMATQGQSPFEMLRMLRRSLGTQTHITTLLKYFRQAFGLSLTDVKPIVALSRNEQRAGDDESLLDNLLLPAIFKHRTDWESSKP
ncbi:MAG: hypothetical protein ACYC3I_24620 [Gemmataceae bacterium]